METPPDARSSKVLRLMEQFQEAYRDAEEGYRKELGLNETDLRALRALGINEQLSPGQLAERLSLTSASITAVLDRLATHGYIRREAHSHDRRKTLIRHGENFPGIPQQTAMRLRSIYRAYRELGETEQQTILGFLTQLCKVLESAAENQPRSNKS